jgi:ABC-type sugar transport system ATPase subunit
MPEIVLENVVKKYGTTKAIDNVSVTISEGEFCVIVGPSGSGKTTLLNLISGFVMPDSGQIMIGRENVEKIPPRNRDIGMVFQDIGLFSHMTVRQNLEYGLKLRKTDKSVIQKQVNEIADKLKINQLLDKKPNMISGGEAQRVAIGRTLILDPPICLFDEPLGNLDANLRVEILEEIKYLHKSMGKTFVFVTHDQEQALSAGTKIIVMKDGKIMQTGHPLEIYHNPQNRFVAEFFGISSMNLIAGRVVDLGGSVGFESEGMKVKLKDDLKQYVGRRVFLAVRPLNIYLEDQMHDVSGFGTVNLIEKLGDKNLVYLKVGGDQKIVASTPPQHKYSLQDKIRIGFDADKLHIYDQEQGERLI